ncbi:type 1 glutamine amidotransferase [Paraferrimonas haliotis]|uniref:Glutamine amidotransferase n=1 Tax=Paraferrimonas haliotis TaxID=2013866 RepID=A0AA37TRQ6_9GAMM|nr:type 1 glutamine amidotransferase [Paraferrimonas haliotis]GLS84030.1 glutamine amidotransferase [Paraferrimonas haliotis]
MKRIGITQRVDVVSSYAERRDALDQNWYELVLEVGAVPVPLPNLAPEQVPALMQALDLDGVILSGGNSLGYLDDTASDYAPERDAFETALIDYALADDLPLVGVCRGLQIINHCLGGHLEPVQHHVAVEHSLTTISGGDYQLPERVNSYHAYGIPATGLGQGLRALATDEQGNIEAFEHQDKPVFGMMWHPERGKPFSEININLLKRILL